MSARLATHAALALALLSCAQAPGIQAPPAKWESGSLPVDLKYIEVPAYLVGETCHGLGDLVPEDRVLACYSFGRRVIVLPRPASDPLLYRALRRHEEGHARGWPASHPTAP